MQPTWVVVADRACATIYTVPRGMARLRRLAELHESPPSTHDEASQPCGRGGHISDRADSVEGQTRAFIETLALYLEDARRDRRFDELILVAAPGLLANLRGRLGQAVRDAVIAEIAKDLVGAHQDTLQEQVLRVL